MIDLRLYYWATQLVVINDWLCGGWADSAYIRELQPLGLDGILGLLYGSPVTNQTPEVTRVIFGAWRGALRWTGWSGRLTLSTPLWVGTWLPHSAGLEGFSGWDRIGITLLGDILKKGVVKSFAELQSEFQMHSSQFFRYLQLRHALAASSPQLKDLAEFNPLEAKLFNGPLRKGAISKIYRSLIVNSPESFAGLRQR